MSDYEIMEAADGLLQLDPVRTYPQRAAEAVAKLVEASGYRLELVGEQEEIEASVPSASPNLSMPLRQGREQIGTLHLYCEGGRSSFGEDATRKARWAARLMARGLDYMKRLAVEGGRRSGEAVAQTLSRAPLTPRERDVVALLVSGASTRDIASRTGLTVSTVNTYLKRIFSKLGVHSRVELVARMAGTTNGAAAYQAKTDQSSDSATA